MSHFSPLQRARLKFQPILPEVLQSLTSLRMEKGPAPLDSVQKELTELFPEIHRNTYLHFVQAISQGNHQVKRVGVVLSGGQAPGGHNVIAGLFDALKKLNSSSLLFGFQEGPKGVLENRFIEITAGLLDFYRNQGGFDLIGSGRDKIENREQFELAKKTALGLNLDGIVIIGGDDSNTNAALLAEYFKAEKVNCSVVGVPKTIDGDLRSQDIEISFGFDTACKTYAEAIGNIARDALSAKKYYYFIKLMGRSASHITLECALQTQPNLALIGEEVEAHKKTLKDVTQEICDVICKRAQKGKNYGVILIPEGIVEFIPEFKNLISELNTLLAEGQSSACQLETLSSREEKIDFVLKLLTPDSAECLKMIPPEIQTQLLLERDPHGNVQVSKIETERLLMEMVRIELTRRKKQGLYQGKFSAQPQFCGYEGRSGLPSNFDSQYCYALGHVAALLINAEATGYISCVKSLRQPVEKWEIAGVPLVPMMQIEKRHGKFKPVIKKALVELNSPIFRTFEQSREAWALEDLYLCPGPIQFYGPRELTDSIPHIL